MSRKYENNQESLAGVAFDIAVVPTVTNGAYSAGDIMGGLLTFPNVHRMTGGVVLIQEVQVAMKAAVTPTLTLVIFSADPTSTTKTDNASYGLDAADVFKVKASIPIVSLGGYWTNHGTPRTLRLGNLAIPIKLADGDTNLYGLLIDGTGVTLTSIDGVQIRLAGVEA